MRVVDPITSLLEFGVLARFEVFVELFGILAVFDTQVDDLARGLCVGKIETRGGVELDILVFEAKLFACFEALAGHAEELDCEAAWLGDSILLGVSDTLERHLVNETYI